MGVQSTVLILGRQVVLLVVFIAGVSRLRSLPLIWLVFELAGAAVTEMVEHAEKWLIHYTPKYGSWLNIAEIELNVMTRQCLARRLDSIAKIQQELTAWESMRNKECGKVVWHFTTPQARTKLLSLYPKFESSGD